MSCDPLGLQEGPNLYAYTANNPIRFVDVKGLAPSDHQKLYGMTGSDAPWSVAPQSDSSASAASGATPARASEHKERNAAGMTAPDSPASVEASSPANAHDRAAAALGRSEPRAEERRSRGTAAHGAAEAAENWFSGIQTTVEFGSAFTDPVTGKFIGAIGEAAGAEGILNKGRGPEERHLVIDKVGSREVQGYGIGASLTVSWDAPR